MILAISPAISGQRTGQEKLGDIIVEGLLGIAPERLEVDTHAKQFNWSEIETTMETVLDDPDEEIEQLRRDLRKHFDECQADGRPC
jgi:hypothetical protein